MCTPVWEAGNRATSALLTRAAFFNPMFAYIRKEDQQKFNTLEKLNAPGVKIATYDGISESIRNIVFPKAESVPLPQFSDSSQALLSVSTKKATAVFDNPSSIDLFNQKSDIPLVAVGQKPVRLFGNSFAVKLGEYSLKHMLDTTIESLITSGEAESIIKKYPEFQAALPLYRE